MTQVDDLVRLATEDDPPTLAKMYLRLFRHVHKTNGGTEEEKLRYDISKMRTGDNFIFLAEKDGEAVGTIAVRLLSEGVGFVHDAWVEPNHRRKSVMTGLEGRAVGFLRERGFTTAELKVRADNARTREARRSLPNPRGDGRCPGHRPEALKAQPAPRAGERRGCW